MTTSFLKSVQSEVVAFQINEKDSKAGGGSCFGLFGRAGVPGQVRRRGRVVRQLVDLQRDRHLPARRHGVLAGLPEPVPLRSQELTARFTRDVIFFASASVTSVRA